MSKTRQHNVEQLDDECYDVLVVGAGINGAVSAAALAASGARVALIDKGDFAGNTSSNSSNLVWGGIKYLESHEYSLVSRLCAARNQLMRARPSSVREIRFLASVQRGFRFPAFAAYVGTLVYWLMGRMATARPRYLRVREIKRKEPLIDASNLRGGVEYSDCHLRDGDARFVWSFVASLLRLGGTAANYVAATTTRFDGEQWRVQAKDDRTGRELSISARSLVNACGPEVDTYNEQAEITTQTRHVFSKGIHLVVDRLTPEDRILTFFASDGRMFFISPAGSRSTIGTTDTRVDAPRAEVTDEDREFVLGNANEMLALDKPLTKDDIVSERCGVRPLAVRRGEATEGDFLQLSRKHILEINSERQHVSIFGGKLTDCIHVGNEVVEAIRGLGFSLSDPGDHWYAEPDETAKQRFMKFAGDAKLDELADPRAREKLSERLWRRYDAAAQAIAESIVKTPALARLLWTESDYTPAEVKFATESEHVTCVDDLLRRRSDLATVVGPKALASTSGLFGDGELGRPKDGDTK